MTFKIALATTTTAVGLMMGAAFAGSENEAYLEQKGARNPPPSRKRLQQTPSWCFARCGGR
ncbi:hypothetical protein G6N74_27205 [Mesorhizobium sp. CGMCC 1.15528]|uniref:Uncharacterized protein n=1 Tax=Mesorhizobium zhangyense TaxID=1776730 RepID=A0A7C9VGB3_9HYPH|nr:hypothetical protein [Mesorhizobium zhangyense]NGN44749.1 hypothetical protein [Mesorhizobium zhangyense]